MNETPYIPFYTSDFLGGTGGMTAATKGVYITLLCLMYEAEGPINQKWDTLARRCGASLPAFKRAVSALADEGKISISEDGLWSKKCEKHLDQRRERRKSAKAAAKRRWQKEQQKQGEGDASALRPQCQSETDKENTLDANASNDADGVDFERALFQNGVRFLCNHGSPERQARSVIGKWRKDHEDRDIFEAFVSAKKKGVVDPIPWITARLTPKPTGLLIDLQKVLAENAKDA